MDTTVVVETVHGQDANKEQSGQCSGDDDNQSDGKTSQTVVPTKLEDNIEQSEETKPIEEEKITEGRSDKIVDNSSDIKFEHRSAEKKKEVEIIRSDTDIHNEEDSKTGNQNDKTNEDTKGQEEEDEDVDSGDIDDDEDGDPIPSGTGAVSKDCSASDLIGWSEILPKWHSKLNQRPKGLNTLVRNGIPEPLRGEVWQLLSGAQQCSLLMEQYRLFLTKSAPTEQIILRDVHRTYPAHENFQSGAGSSSLLDSLFKVCKAYAVYDEEVSYCQGLSFLVAALLLHMPEEQAFCVFVRIMKHYGLRDLFRNNFDELYLKFYQLEHLLEDHMPDLHQHFQRIGIEPFTYASQWFLTVFTAKFPLNAVFHIMDIFLLDGMNTIFQIALALLGSSKQRLLALDFEGVLKYFRVQMPKRYRIQENVEQLIRTSSEISLKRLKKHANNYELAKQKEKLLENPVTRLQRENAKLTENNLRLEQENDDLARDLVASKIQLRAQLDFLEDKTETLNKALTYSRQDCQSYLSTISDMEDERSRLEVEVSQLKEVCRRELHRAESELARDSSIIADYKKICSKLSKRLDSQLACAQKFIETTQDLLRDNESCATRKCYELFREQADILTEQMKSEDNQQISTTLDGDSPSRRAGNSDRRVSSESDPANRPIGAYIKSSEDSQQATSSEIKIKQLTEHIDGLEVELARTKLALVEAECKCQQLTHDLTLGVTVKTSSSSTQQGIQSTGLTGRLDFMKSAVSSRRPPMGAGGAFAKINNLISEKISNISNHSHASSSEQNPTSSLSVSSSSPAIASNSNNPITKQPAAPPTVPPANNNDSHNSNKSATTVGQDQC